MPYKRFLGYERGEDGQPVINEEQAELVRRIYKMFVNGMTPSGIAKKLTNEKIPTPGGRENWQSSVVESILTNEKYKGDALLQKTFCTDYLTKKMKVNEGEVPQYYVEGSHPAIIGEELFDYVQQELKARKAAGYSGNASPLANRIVCGDCGRFFGSKLWHSTDKYRCTVWQCNWKFKNEKQCKTPHFKEKEIERAFVDAFNSTLENKEQIIDQYERIISTITDCTEQERRIHEIDNDCAVLETVIEKFIKQNARTVMNQEEYNSRYNELAARYDVLQNSRSELNSEITTKKAKRKSIKEYMRILKKQNKVLSEFDPDLWRSVVNKMEVFYDRQVVFHFMDGSKVSWEV